ncbi:hypothetical protein FRB96_001608 [Tulasnella sp. 330]|nr:hypothetical protein FRB96_001608 [Tulasnella sp. 330]
MDQLLNEVSQALGASLNPDINTRVAAELKLSQLMEVGDWLGPGNDLDFTTERAIASTDKPSKSFDASRSIYLADKDSILLVEHSAGTLLQRRYVPEHWSPFFPAFKGNAPGTELKDKIRDTILHGLSDPIRKIRSIAGFALSTIAQSDWPDECPNLFVLLIELLSSGSSDSVDGTMRVFAEFIKTELSEDQILPVLRQLLPVLLNVIGSPERHSQLTRYRALSVFYQCMQVLFMVKDEHPQAVKEATEFVLPTWLNALKVLLEIDPRQDVASSEHWDGLSIRLQVFKILERVTYGFSRVISSSLPVFMAIALSHLEQLLPTFHTFYLQSDATPTPGTTEDPSEVDLLTRLTSSILEFLATASRTNSGKAWLSSNDGQQALPSLIRHIVAWAQMTNDEEEQWATDVNAFIADDNNEESWTIRDTGCDLMEVLIERIPGTAGPALPAITLQLAREAMHGRTSSMANWWKPLEAALAICGSAARHVPSEGAEPAARDIGSLLTDEIPALLSLRDVPFLQGRSFVFASNYSKHLPPELTEQYLCAALDILEHQETPIPVKVSAIVAIKNFCLRIVSEDDVGYEEVVAQAPRIVRDLTPLLGATTDESLSLVADALFVAVEINESKWLTTEITEPLVAALMQVWVQNVKDPILLSTLSDSFVTLAKCPIPEVYQAVVKHTLPTLASAMSHPGVGESWINSSAIDLATSLMRGATKGNLGEGFFAVLGPALFACILATEDREVIQNGIECLTLVIRKGCDQLMNFVSPTTGETGLTLVLKVVAAQLGPASLESEAGGLFIGDMIVHLLRNATAGSEQLRSVLPELLGALVRRMETAKTATFMQSLIIPFAYLIHERRDELLTLLLSMAVGTTNGLDILIKAWCENVEAIQGAWAQNMSVVAFCDLFVCENPALRAIQVQGDLIIRPETKDVPTEWTSVPFPVRALKILVSELRNSGEDALAVAEGKRHATGEVDVDLEVDEDDGEEWADEEDLYRGLKSEEMGFLSQYLDEAALGERDEPESVESDMRADPVSHLDTRTHLISFFRQCAQSNVNDFSRVADEMNMEEMMILKKAISG